MFLLVLFISIIIIALIQSFKIETIRDNGGLVLVLVTLALLHVSKLQEVIHNVITNGKVHKTCLPEKGNTRALF